MTGWGSRRGFLRFVGGTLAGAAVLGGAAKAAPDPAVRSPARPVTDPLGPQELTFPGPASTGTDIPQFVAEAGYLYPGVSRGGIEVVWQVDMAQKLIALTFDDGPVPGASEVVYDVLDEAKIPATLFLVGNRVERYGGIMHGRVDRHEIGNHTHSHQSMFTRTSDQIMDELTAAHKAISKVLGREPTLFRPPFSHVNGAVLVASAAMGYDLVMWSGYIGPQGYEDGDSDRLVRDVVAAAHPGAIVLNHEGPEYMIGIRAVPRIVKELQAQGYEFVTVSQLRAAQRK